MNLNKVIADYKDLLNRNGFTAIKQPDDLLSTNSYFQLQHCRWMLEQVEMFVKEGQTGDTSKIEKAHRWLGFIQGVLWAQAFFSIEQLKEHNR